MPAELAYTDGTADFFEVGSRRSAWHREGHLIPPDREIKVPEALELIHGDYEVVRQPTFYPVDEAFQLRQSNHAYVTIRTDTGKELGAVGRSYTVLQNVEAFRALEPLLDQGVVRLETGGVLRSGADIWMLGRFDTDRQRAGFDEFHTFEEFDWDAPVTFDRDRVRDLFDLSFLEQRQDVVFLGPVGVGKTFLACALGHAACRAGHHVLFLRSDRMLKLIHQFARG